MMRRLLDLTEQEPSDLEGGRKGGQALLPLLPKPTPSSPPHQTRTTAAGDLVAAGVVGVASAVTVSLADHVHHPLHHHHLDLHNPFQRELQLVEGIHINIYIHRERERRTCRRLHFSHQPRRSNALRLSLTQLGGCRQARQPRVLIRAEAADA